MISRATVVSFADAVGYVLLTTPKLVDPPTHPSIYPTCATQIPTFEGRGLYPAK